MEKEKLKRIFEFIKDKDNKRHKKYGTFEWKLLFNEPLTEEDLNVKGDLNLAKTNITHLPEGLKVDGNFYLTSAPKLKSLPSNLDVKGGLNLAYSGMTSLPEGLEFGGGLFLQHAKINSLPEGLKVSGSLHLEHTKIESLPEGLKVRGDLFLDYSDINLLPEGLEVGGSLSIENTPLRKYTDDQLRDMIKPGFIKGDIIR